MINRLSLLISIAMIASAMARVIVVSVDGLRSDAVTTWGPEMLPNFYRLRAEGAFTDNARTDYDFTETLPNHTSMITGRPVLGKCGHGMDVNFGNANTNLHANGYKASMFDVAHDHGLSTGLFVGKEKLEAFFGSYDSERGAPDVTGEDNGRNKIDYFLLNSRFPNIINGFVYEFKIQRWDLSMLHIRLPDTIGHTYDWSLDLESPYMESIVAVDGYLGQLFEAIAAVDGPSDTTYVILTADHGGEEHAGFTHVDPILEKNYTIPFYVWGPGVKEGGDLYDLNPDLFDPGRGRPTEGSAYPPIRNGMVGNLALDLLNLPPIPGSCLNLSQQLQVSDRVGFPDLFPRLDPDADANGNGFSNFFDYAIGADPEGSHRADLMPRIRRGGIEMSYRTNTADVVPRFEISADMLSWWPLHEGVTYVPLSSEETSGGRRLLITTSMIINQGYFRQAFER